MAGKFSYYLKKVPLVGKFIHMVLDSRKFQVVIVGLVASVLIMKVGLDEATAAELSEKIVYASLALAGYIAVEDHGRHSNGNAPKP